VVPEKERNASGGAYYFIKQRFPYGLFFGGDCIKDESVQIIIFSAAVHTIVDNYKVTI
jgi:hypothetical protein